MNVDDPSAVLELRCRDAWGHLNVHRFTQAGPLELPGSGLPARWLHDETTGRRYVHKLVPAAHAQARLPLLENEVRALSRLAQVFGHDRYPPSLPWMVGFNLSEAEPFIVLSAYLGEPVSLRQKLDEPSRRVATIGLFRAVALTAAAGVQHAAVNVAALRWDGRLVQLVDFEQAVVGDEPRHDVRAAGLVACQLTGAWIPLGDDQAPSQIPRELRKPLRKVFGPVERRPTANDVLSRLNEQRVAAEAGPGSWLLEGERRFEDVCDRKRQFDPWWRRHRTQVAVVLVVLVLVAVAIGLVLR